MPACRLLPYAVADGPHNMAADEVLLEASAVGVPSLRFYGWSPPTVSLGYFQSEQVRRSDERLGWLPFVRRLSGGATLVHHCEVTYALGLPAGAPWQTGESWLLRMHRMIAAALAGLSIIARPYTPAGGAPSASILCFRHLTPGDLLIGGCKVVGSAQRRQRGALMQHGGILLAASPYTPALLGIRELTGQELAAPEVCAAITAEFVRQTGWELVHADWTEAERRRKDELAAAKYSSEKWNRKR